VTVLRVNPSRLRIVLERVPAAGKGAPAGKGRV